MYSPNALYLCSRFPPLFSLFGLSVTTGTGVQTTGTGTDTSDLNPTGSSTPSKNSADRTNAAGGTGLIFGVLAAMIL